MATALEPAFIKVTQETLNTKTKECWPISLAVWNDPIQAIIKKMIEELKLLSKP